MNLGGFLGGAGLGIAQGAGDWRAMDEQSARNEKARQEKVTFDRQQAGLDDAERIRQADVASREAYVNNAVKEKADRAAAKQAAADAASKAASDKSGERIASAYTGGADPYNLNPNFAVAGLSNTSGAQPTKPTTLATNAPSSVMSQKPAEPSKAAPTPAETLLELYEKDRDRHIDAKNYAGIKAAEENIIRAQQGIRNDAVRKAQMALTIGGDTKPLIDVYNTHFPNGKTANAVSYTDDKKGLIFWHSDGTHDVAPVEQVKGMLAQSLDPNSETSLQIKKMEAQNKANAGAEGKIKESGGTGMTAKNKASAEEARGMAAYNNARAKSWNDTHGVKGGLDPAIIKEANALHEASLVTNPDADWMDSYKQAKQGKQKVIERMADGMGGFFEFNNATGDKQHIDNEGISTVIGDAKISPPPPDPSPARTWNPLTGKFE